jgi:cytochrome c biogenesis protein CcmG, thiol:disulfide interchange protein DsbE
VILRLLICLNLSLIACVSAAPLQLDFLKVGSKVYSNVTIIGANTTDLYFTHSQGISNVKLRTLDEKLRQRFQYDPKLAAEAERQQSEQDTAYQGALVAQLVAQAQKAARAARLAASTSESSLADPISDNSLLGKPGPPLNPEKWLGPPPVLKGKAALVIFWAPWSIPCRKAIPELNALQRQFADRLVIVGITSEPEDEVKSMAEPRPEFVCGIDSKSQLIAAAGVTSVPYALLLDGKGTVRYQGHPGVLDAKKMESLLPAPGQ